MTEGVGLLPSVVCHQSENMNTIPCCYTIEYVVLQINLRFFYLDGRYFARH